MANTKNQIASLQAQIANYTGAIGGLGIPSIQIELESILNSLQIAYNAYNAANVDLTPYNLKLMASRAPSMPIKHKKTNIKHKSIPSMDKSCK